MNAKRCWRSAMSIAILGLLVLSSSLVTQAAVTDDPLLRMPGSQPNTGITLEAPNRCFNCHAGYNQAVEPAYNWKGSMMAQAMRDPIFWACLTVAAQDAKWAVGSTNATDLCLRCHSPAGWVEGRSDPTNGTAMTGSDFDGLHCDVCHRMWDPFFKTTYNGTREGADWSGYWDEHNNTGPGSGTLSQVEADKTLAADQSQALTTTLFSGQGFFVNNEPKYAQTYNENGSGQFYFDSGGDKRASFADAAARHQMLYSRYHKSRDFCGTCHDVSNPVLANLTNPLPDQSGGQDLTTEQYAAFRYFHVERTFSEFRLSAYGRQGGAPTNPEFQAQGASNITNAARCQDCHMRDVVGVACNKNGVPIRPTESTEHPNSGLPFHDLTGGNTWVSYILASTDPAGPVYDSVNANLLNQGPATLVLDMTAGETPTQNGAALKAGSDRALQQLQLAASLLGVAYHPNTGTLRFRLQNNTGHKLISGFPEGRRMFVNIKVFQGGSLIYEVNPYDMTAGTLRGLDHPSSPPLNAKEAYVDELVYEVHPSSDLTGEEQTFHFVLATGRSKDIRIPPKGFDIANAAERIVQPVWHGQVKPDYFTADEYAGGYDEVNMIVAAGGDEVQITVYYQGTSREYIEFLRDEINGTATSLPASAYIAQTDPFFAQLRAWGDTMWQLWQHNHGLDGLGASVPGIVPVVMTSVTVGSGDPCDAPTPTLISATPSSGQVQLVWSDEHTAATQVGGYGVYYDQAGKAQLIANLGLLTSYTDTGLTNGQPYSYKITTRTATCESPFSNIISATPNNPGQSAATVTTLSTSVYQPSGKSKNATTLLMVTDTFAVGDNVLIKAKVNDADTGLPLAGADVQITIDGPDGPILTSATSDADGVAEAQWKTIAPNKKGDGGTSPGTYSATVTDVSAVSHPWDGQTAEVIITLQ